MFPGQYVASFVNKHFLGKVDQDSEETKWPLKMNWKFCYGKLLIALDVQIDKMFDVFTKKC